MAFKTGRSRTFPANGTVTGNVAFGAYPPFPSGGFFYSPNTPTIFSGSNGQWDTNNCTFTYHITGPTFSGSTYWYGISIQVNIAGFCGVTATLNGSNPTAFGPYTTNTVVTHEEALTGSWSLAVPADEYMSFTESASFSSAGGAGLEDTPHDQTLTLFELPQAGSTLTVSFSLNGAVISQTFPVVTQTALSYDMSGILNISINPLSHAPSGGGASVSQTWQDTLVLSCSLFDAGVGAPYTRSNADMQASVSGLTGTLTNAAGTAINPALGTLNYGGAASKSYSAIGTLRAWDNAYPNPLTVKIDRASNDNGHPFAASGAFSDSNTQYRFHASCTLNSTAEGDGISPTISVDTFGDLRVYLDRASLSANADDPNDWRCLLHGYSFAGIGLSQSSAVAVDDATALTHPTGDYRGTWSAGGAATVTQAASEIVIACSGASTDTALRSFTATGGAGFSGYRYLSLAIRADTENRPFSVVLGSKTYRSDYTGALLTAGTVRKTVYIDLCAQPASSDGSDTKWPLPTVDGVLWGVTSVTALTLSSLAANGTYKIASLSLVRHPAAPKQRASFVPALTQWVLETPPVIAGDNTTTTSVRRFLQCDTDERLSCEEVGYRRTVITTASTSSTSYAPASIADLINGVNKTGGSGITPSPNNAGWLATGTTVAADPAAGGLVSDWLNCNRPCEWLYGGGALYAKIAPDTAFAWHYGIDLNASASVSAPAQMTFDALSWYPGCGDAFSYTDGSYGGAIVVPVSKILRGQSWGIVYNLALAPVPGALVTLNKTSTQVQEASANADTAGGYFTGSTYAREAETYDTISASGTMPFSRFTRLFAGRYRYRACFSVSQTVIFMPSNHATRDGRYHRANVKMSGGIEHRRSGLLIPPFDTLSTPSSSAADSEPVHAQDARGRLYALFTRAAQGIIGVYSDDEANTWSNEENMLTGGTHPHIQIASSGSKLRAAYITGNIHGQVQPAGEADYSAEFVFMSGTDPLLVADDKFSFAPLWEQSGRWALVCCIQGENAPSEWTSADDGRTWKRVT